MGLDTDFDAWHGAYSAFMKWRCKIAEVAGLPPLELMEGFFEAQETRGFLPTFYLGVNPDPMMVERIKRMEALLPIKWSCLKKSPLHQLLYHSDCDGSIGSRSCGPIADALEKLLPLLPDEDAGGHIGNWREKTQQFINGLRAAKAARKPLRFH